METDSWTATAASTIIVPASEFRDVLLIQKTNDTTVALGVGVAAEAGKGVQLYQVGDAVVLRGAASRCAIYALGNGATGIYQEGDVTYVPGPTLAAE